LQHALRVVDVDVSSDWNAKSDMVSWRWINVITVASRFDAMRASNRRLFSAISER